MAIKDWNGFKKSGDTYIPNDATARAGVTATVDLLKDTTGFIGGNECVNNAVSKTENGVTWTVNADKSISAYGQPTEGDAYIDVNAGANVSANGIAWKCVGCPSGGGNDKYYSQIRLSNPDGTWHGARSDTGNGYQLSGAEVTANVKIQYRCVIPSGAPAIPQSSPIVFRPMIISPEEYAISPSYRPYHGTVDEVKADKTEVQATVDLLKDTTGWTGKNRMIFDVSTTSANDVNLTLNDNKTFTVNTEIGGASALTVIRVGYITEAGQYILNGCPEGGGDSTYRLDVRPNGSSSPYSGSVDSGSGSNVVTVKNNDLPATVNLRIPSGAEISDKLFKPMIRRPNTSPDYEPYHESVEKMLTPKLLPSGSNLNNYITEGDYFAGADTYDNCPFSNTAFRLKVLPFNNPATRCIQIIYANKPDPEVYMRTNFGGTWQSWYKFTGTVVS